MTATVRPLEHADLGRVHEINEANVPEVGSIDRRALDRLVSLSALALVVDGAGPGGGLEPAGFCLVLAPGADYASVNYGWFMERYDDAMYLDRVAVDAAFRGRGLGSLLYAEVDRLLAADFAHMARLTLEVNVDPPNEPSLAFHARRGFAEVGRQTTDYGVEVSLMERPIPAA